MPGENIQDWSVTAANNSNSDSAISWAEGQARASVNDSARSMMAAHAKDRNLHNGSIVTSGAANAQIFFTGLNYTTIPTWLTVRLRIGPGLTNTGAATLNADNIGAVQVLDNNDNALTAGLLQENAYYDFLYNGTYWNLVGGDAIQQADKAVANAISLLPTMVTPQHGKLLYSSATQLYFYSRGGSQIKINGVIYNFGLAVAIPSTAVRVDGTVTAVVANTNYMVFLTDAYGLPPVAEFRTFGSGQSHVTSNTAGNEGVEVLYSGGSLFDNYTLIGMVSVNSSAHFQNDASFRGVISWFNRGDIALSGFSTSGANATTTTPTELLTASRVLYLTWAEEAVRVGTKGFMYGNTTGMTATASVYNDGAEVAGINGTIGGVGYQLPVAMTESLTLTEGFHVLTAYGNVDTGTGIYYLSINGMIRG